jgi:hypothetical protein
MQINVARCRPLHATLTRCRQVPLSRTYNTVASLTAPAGGSARLALAASGVVSVQDSDWDHINALCPRHCRRSALTNHRQRQNVWCAAFTPTPATYYRVHRLRRIGPHQWSCTLDSTFFGNSTLSLRARVYVHVCACGPTHS